MAGEWRTTTLGKLSHDGTIELQTGPFGSQLHAHDYVENGVCVVPTEAIRNRRIDRELTPSISISKAKDLFRHRLQRNDILFARRGVQATGHIGYVRAEEEGFICGTGAIRLRVRKDNSEISPDFLSHLLSDPASVRWFKFHAIGATMPNLNEGIILSFALLLPPISDQAVIASLLGALDDKIALNRRMAQTLEATARALFRSWFVDFDPVRAKAEGRETGLDAETAAAFPDAFGEDGLPVGWRTELAGTLFEIAIGRTPPRVEQHWFSSDPSDVPWISIRDLGASGTYISKSNEYLTRDAVRQFRVKTISIGTVVLSFKLTVGRVAIASREMVSNEAIAQFTPLEKTHFGSEYLYCFLKAFDFNSLGSTSSIANAVNSDSIRRIPILVPSKEIHRAFCGSVDSIFKRLKCVQDEIGSLAAIRDTLLPRLISGELRIADAEKKIEAA